MNENNLEVIRLGRVDIKTLTPNRCKFMIEPLERGFGHTLGSSLRRVLLSSLVGTAISHVRIKGVLHEFSTIPGVKEDVADIILNLKELRLNLLTDKPEIVRIRAKGEKIIKACDVITNNKVAILNPDHHIATLSKEGNLDMEMMVKNGRGYVPAERNRDENEPLGTIFIDSIFTPIEKVNYQVSQVRVSKRTDYDRLILEVWTDGSISPKDALKEGAKILQDQLMMITDMRKGTSLEETEENAEKPKGNENLFRSVDELELSIRSQNCLKNADIRYIYELIQKTEPEMLKTKNFGRKSLNEIKAALNEIGLSLGVKLDDTSLKDLQAEHFAQEDKN